MKRFNLVRLIDATGISGTGRVAEGAVFETGQAVLCWLSEHSSIAIYSSFTELMTIHGHNGQTIAEWVDE